MLALIIFLVVAYIIGVALSESDKPASDLKPSGKYTDLRPPKYMSREDKIEYMKSIEWRLLKGERLRIADHKCEKCGEDRRALHLHHITYERLGEEEIDDLRILCSDCHLSIHLKYGFDRNGHYPID